MEYISVKEIAKKWGIDTSRVGRLAREGRINGAKLVGHNWLIPIDAEKPLDERRADVKNNPVSEEEKSFRFPTYINTPEDAFFPPLTEDEKILRRVEILLQECRFADAKRVLGNLPYDAENRYARCGALYAAGLIALSQPSAVDFRNILTRFENELKEEFPYKKEMEILYYSLLTSYGNNKYFIRNFTIDTTYRYHPTAYPTLLAFTAFSMFTANTEALSDSHFSNLELECQMLENGGRFSEAQSLHISLMLLYSLRQDYKKMVAHASEALRLGLEHHLYYLPATYFIYYTECFESALKTYPDEYSEMIREASASVHEGYIRFAEQMSLSTVYSLLPKRYFPLVNYALTDLPNKVIADLMGLSESTVNNRYSEIYDILGIRGKQELRQHFRKSFADGTVEQS